MSSILSTPRATSCTISLGGSFFTLRDARDQIMDDTSLSLKRPMLASEAAVTAASVSRHWYLGTSQSEAASSAPVHTQEQHQEKRNWRNHAQQQPPFSP